MSSYVRPEYTTGSVRFCGRKILVDPRVLVPRPEAEVTATVALATTRQLLRSARRPITVADIGTGSGALIVTIAAGCASPAVTYFATDISADALDVAKDNAVLHGLEDRIIFLEGDLLECLPGVPDVIVANLPYRPKGSPAPPHVVCEPEVAVFDIADGTGLVTKLLTQIKASHTLPASLILQMDGEKIPALKRDIEAMFSATGVMVTVHEGEAYPDASVGRVLEARWQQPR